MSLTGPLTLVLAALLAVAVPAVAVVTWNRVGRGGSRAGLWQRWMWRSAAMLASQLTAVVLVAVLANDAGNFYSSWLELLGERHTVHTSALGPGLQDRSVEPKLQRAGAHGHGIVVPLPIAGTHSRIGTFSALVYLPEQYGLPQYAHRAFPVVELIAGSPGTPKTWTASLNIAGILDREIAAGRSLPFIAVMPSQDVAGRRDTQCVNVANGPAVETYLTLDVRSAVARAFRVNTERDAWAVMGYSSGGFCATNLAMRHPDLFSAAVSIAGYCRPAHDHQTGELFGHDTQRRDENTPLWRAANLPPPDVSLLLMSSAEDPATRHDATALAEAARAPLAVTLISLKHGGHNFQVWRAEEPVAFAWASAHLTAPLAPAPVIDNTNPVVVTSH